MAEIVSNDPRVASNAGKAQRVPQNPNWKVFKGREAAEHGVRIFRVNLVISSIVISNLN